MAGAEVARAYVTLIPKFSNLGGSISSQLAGVNTGSLGSKLGSGLSTGAASGFKTDGMQNELVSGMSGAGTMAGSMLSAGIVAGAAAAVAGITAIATSAVKAYSSYEQLTGGVETLFGQSAGIVENYAANAYQTAGISANDYMSQATSFSATLLQGLGGDTQAAAQYANVAITDMSDNANKMGTSIGSIQDAYQGFAKDNFTMLDNLKLGYGGTASEMARLVNDSGVMGDSFQATAENVKDIPFDQLIQAIHVTQQGMGITGTTALEAATTVEGSVNMMKASWTNWLTGLGNSQADMSGLTTQLVGSLQTVITNITPVLASIANGMVSALPSLLTSAVSMITGLITQIAGFLPTLIPALLQGAVTLFMAICDAIPQIAVALGAALPQMITAVCEILPTLIPQLIQGAVNLFLGFVQALPQVITALVAAIPQVIEAVIQILPTLIPALLVAAVQLFLALVQAVGQILGALLTAIGDLIGQGIASIGSFFGGMLDQGIQLVMNIVNGIGGAASGVASAVGDAVQGGVNAVGDFLGSIKDAGMNLIRGLADGISGAVSWVMDAISSLCSNAIDAVKDFFGIHSPSKVMHGMGEYLMQGMANGIDASASGVVSAMQSAMTDVSNAASVSATAEIAGSTGSVGSAELYAGFGLGNTTVNINGNLNDDARINELTTAYLTDLARLRSM